MTWMLQGAHRGGAAVTGRLSPLAFTTLGDDMVIADPAPGRAASLRQQIAWSVPDLCVRPFEETGASVLSLLPADATLVLASDSAGGIHDTLVSRSAGQKAAWQLCGRGPGGTAGRRFALHGTVLAGDSDTLDDSLLLLDTLGRIAPPASSRQMTGGDPLSSAVLAPLRAQASRRTADRLAFANRAPQDLAGGSLCIFGGVRPYPLLVQRGVAGERWRDIKARALDRLNRVPFEKLADRGPRSRYAVSAVAIPETPAIHFVTISRTRGDRRRVEGHAPFEVPPSSSNRAGMDWTGYPVVTD